MNVHKNAPLTIARRLEMVKAMLEQGLTPVSASRPPVRGWGASWPKTNWAWRTDLRVPTLSPAGSRPGRPWQSWSCAGAELTQARIAVSLGLSKSTVSRVLARAGLSRLRDLEPCEPVLRYERAAPAI